MNVRANTPWVSSRRPRHRRRQWRLGRALAITVSIVAAIVITASPAAATLSIIAVDPETGEVGVAMSACSSVAALGEPDEVPATVVLVPGRGAAVAQGSIDPNDLGQLRAALNDSTVIEADDVVARTVADNDQDLQPVRQYAVVLGGTVAAITGDEVTAPTAGATADNVAVQGTALASEGVVGEAMAAFLSARNGGASLDDALVAALAAGAAAGGDSECGEQTALFAHVAVVNDDGDGTRPERLLTVTVDEGDGQNPVVLLERAHSESRTGWIDAGLRSPTRIPRWLVGAVGAAMAVASIVVIRYGLGYRRRPRR